MKNTTQNSTATNFKSTVLAEDFPPTCVDVLCWFKAMDKSIICRVGHWNSLLQRWRIHADGQDRYYKEIIDWQYIPKPQISKAQC